MSSKKNESTAGVRTQVFYQTCSHRKSINHHFLVSTGQWESMDMMLAQGPTLAHMALKYVEMKFFLASNTQKLSQHLP